MQIRKEKMEHLILFHPLAVAELLKRYGYDIDYQVAGVLHDVLEDTDATDEEVRAFGEDI